MPVATIEAKKQYDLDREVQVIDAFQGAMMEGLKESEMGSKCPPHCP